MKENSENCATLRLQDLSPEALQSLHPAVEKLILSLIKRVEEQEREIRELRARLNQNSSNSSKPPSSDPPWIIKKRETPTGRQRGGQKGHEGHYRKMLPPEKVNHTLDCYPSRCKNCDTGIENGKESSTDPLRHQVAELTHVRAEVTEYRLHFVECHCCGMETCADLPEGLTWSNFGLRLQAIVALLTGRYRLSRREAEEILQVLFGVEISLGSVSQIEHRISEAIADPVKEAQNAVGQSAVVNTDETGWREANKKAWLWVGVTPQIAVFQISSNRGSEAARQLLGEDFQGIVGSDRWKAYNCFPMERRGICHAHLKRDFQKIEDIGGASKAIGEWGLAEEKRLFEMWEDFKCGKSTREELQANLVPLRARMKRLLFRAQESGDKKTEGMCRDIYKHWEAMWTFAFVEGLDPTNNVAERSLRKGVLWRKGSFGTQSKRGSRFVERILTVTETCRRQGRKVVDFLHDALLATITGKPAPSLLPGSS
jgi:transposase